MWAWCRVWLITALNCLGTSRFTSPLPLHTRPMADMDTAPVAMAMDVEQPVEGEVVGPVVKAEVPVEAGHRVPAQVCVARPHAWFP